MCRLFFRGILIYEKDICNYYRCYDDRGDAAELIVEDSVDAGIPVIALMDRTNPDEWIIENSKAVMYLSYSAEVDHGFGYNGIIRHVTPDVIAAMQTALPPFPYMTQTR